MNEKNLKNEEFKKDIIKVCKKYNLSISHEDSHGSFIITKYDDYYSKWFNEAYYKEDDLYD